MYKLKYFKILILTFLIPRTSSEIRYNSLNDNLILNLIKARPKTNVVGSELLVRLPLCKLASVATGETKEDLLNLLGYRDDLSVSNCYKRFREYIKIMTESDLTMINRIFVNYTDDIDPKFILNSTEKYGVKVEKVGFNYPKAAVAHINNMISAVTFKRVADVVDSNDINKHTKMIIIGGAHFKGTWEFPFDYRLTKLTNFHHIDGRISKIPMMTKIDSFSNVATIDCHALSIKFGNWRASITLILPNTPQDLPKLLNKIQEQKINVNSLVKNMQITPLKVVLPRFKIRTFVDWSGFLQEMGLYSIFDTNSTDLQGILKNHSRTTSDNIALTKMKQKIFVQIDEMGVARFKLSVLKNLVTPKVPLFTNVPTFTADRPFYFEITWDLEMGRYELFTGVYYGPEVTPIIT